MFDGDLAARERDGGLGLQFAGSAEPEPLPEGLLIACRDDSERQLIGADERALGVALVRSMGGVEAAPRRALPDRFLRRRRASVRTILQLHAHLRNPFAESSRPGLRMAPDIRSRPAGVATVGLPGGSRVTVGAWVVEPVALATLFMHRRPGRHRRIFCATQRLLLVPHATSLRAPSLDRREKRFGDAVFFVHELSFIRCGGAARDPLFFRS